MYAFERSSYARERRAATAAEERRDAERVVRDAAALRRRLEEVGFDDEDDDDDDDDGARGLHGVMMKASARGILSSLDALEAELKADAEERANARMKQDEKDARTNRMAADAEARERDPAVKKLVEDAQNAVVTPDGVAPSARAVETFVVKMEEALALEPEYYQVSVQLAVLYYARGCISNAIERARRTYELNPAVVAAYSLSAQMLENIGLYNHAEEAYAKGISVAFDHPDHWAGLAKLSCSKFGALKNGINLLRVALSGGPEAKFKKPGKHPLVLFHLAHALHVQGYSAEPSSLYMRAARAGAGIMTLFPLARIARDCVDDENLGQYIDTWNEMRTQTKSDDVETVTHVFASLDVFNQACVSPQFYELLHSKTLARDVIEHFDSTRTVALPKMVRSEDLDETEDGDAVYVLKGAHEKFPGVYKDVTPRVGRLGEFRSLIGDAASKRSRGEIIAEERVGDVLVDEFGRKCSVRVRVAYVPAADASCDVAYVSNCVSVNSAASEYAVAAEGEIESADDINARELTNRGPSGDESTVISREGEMTEVFKRMLGVDDVSTELLNSVETVVKALRAHARLETNVIQDAEFTAYASIGAPLFMELEFVLQHVASDRGPRPWFIGMQRSKYRQEGERAFIIDIWNRAFMTLDAESSTSYFSNDASSSLARVISFDSEKSKVLKE